LRKTTMETETIKRNTTGLQYGPSPEARRVMNAMAFEVLRDLKDCLALNDGLYEADDFIQDFVASGRWRGWPASKGDWRNYLQAVKYRRLKENKSPVCWASQIRLRTDDEGNAAYPEGVALGKGTNTNPEAPLEASETGLEAAEVQAPALPLAKGWIEARGPKEMRFLKRLFCEVEASRMTADRAIELLFAAVTLENADRRLALPSLKDQRRVLIRRLLRTGITGTFEGKELAEIFGLSPASISMLKHEASPRVVTEAQVDELWAEAEAELARREDEVRCKAGKIVGARANKDVRRD
jgi:hypothetical protein